MSTQKTLSALDVIRQRETEARQKEYDELKELIYTGDFIKAWWREIRGGKTHREAFDLLNNRWADHMGGQYRFSDYKSFEVSKKRFLQKHNL